MKRAIGITTIIGIIFVLLNLSLSFGQGLQKQNNRLIINIAHVVGTRLLTLDSVNYKTESGQDFSISKFKYYIGNIVLKKSNGEVFSTQDYFLVNEEEEESKHLVLNNVPSGNYTSVEFMLGVDSIHNCSGAQSGALDPTHGMFWAWNSGYIFLKLEGKSSFSKSPGHIFEYHVGGYQQPHNCIRNVFLETGGIDFSKAPGTQTLNLKADILELLKTPVTIDFEILSSVTDSWNGEIIADNYEDMFSVWQRQDEN